MKHKNYSKKDIIKRKLNICVDDKPIELSCLLFYGHFNKSRNILEMRLPEVSPYGINPKEHIKEIEKAALNQSKRKRDYNISVSIEREPYVLGLNSLNQAKEPKPFYKAEAPKFIPSASINLPFCTKKSEDLYKPTPL